jgi:hypothetical protein
MTQLVVNRFFDTPLIVAPWAWNADPVAQAVALADAHTADVTGARRHRWVCSVDELHSGPADYAPGAFWLTLAAHEATTLILHDPRGAMMHMHAPHLGFRAPDGHAVEEPQVGTPLRPGEAAMIPGWLVHAVDRAVVRVALTARIVA